MLLWVEPWNMATSSYEHHHIYSIQRHAIMKKKTNTKFVIKVVSERVVIKSYLNAESDSHVYKNEHFP
jgi:hypothetical protein